MARSKNSFRMVEIELQISDDWGNSSTNWGTTTARYSD